MTAPRLRLALAAAAGLALGLAPGPGAAHDNILVHRRMGELSVQQLGNPFFFPWVVDVMEGSYGEDVPATRSLGHFYNPETDSAPWFALGAGAAWENATTQYDAAVTEYGLGNYGGEDAAFYRMGRALHFIQDMTSVAHVHDDQHATDPEDFEDWGPANLDSFDFTGVVPRFAATPTAEGFVKEIARLVYDLTRYPAVLDAFDGCPSQCQQDSVLRTMFPSLHYEDGGFFDGDVWEIDRIGRTDTFLGASDDWWMTSESLIEDNGGRGGSRRLRGDGYIENTGGNSAEPVPVVFNGEPNSGGETMLQIYGRLLYPEAIAYGAGLLQVFADAVGAPPPPTSTGTVTPTPTPTSTPLPQPTATDTPEATATATPAPAICAAAPRGDCRRPASGKSVFVLQNKVGWVRDRLLWKWARGDAELEDFGDPIAGTSYALCVYDDAGAGDTLVLSAEARGGDLCPGKPCWGAAGKTLRYDDRSAGNQGLRQIVLRGGGPGRGRLLVKAEGVGLAMPDPVGPTLLAQSPRARVQFVVAGAGCWEALYGAPALRATAELFRDRSD